MPFPSKYARYFPSGEMAPFLTAFSAELKVSCRSLISCGADEGWRLTNQYTPLPMRESTNIPAKIPSQRPCTLGTTALTAGTPEPSESCGKACKRCPDSVSRFSRCRSVQCPKHAGTVDYGPSPSTC